MKINILFILVLISSQISAQIEHFKYKQAIEKPTEQWHKIQLPNEIFAHLKSDFSDIRIYGITENSDTIETPYFIQSIAEKTVNQSVNFKRINFSNNKKGYYYTFEIPTNTPINEINLDFNLSNFDWQIQLEGSQNQNEWFSILNDYRLVSIQNKWTNYQFTKLVFPDSKYKYYRLLIKSKINPQLSNTTINQRVIQAGNLQEYTIKHQKIKEEKQSKQTTIDIDLGLPVPLSSLAIEFDNTIDYYRNIQIQYLSDSFETENGWRYNYQNLSSGILTSIEQNEFYFSSIITQKLKLIINNYDNPPLKLKSIHTKGLVYELITRIDQNADYNLYYGNKNLREPNYDIRKFTNKIPEQVESLSLEKVEILTSVTPKTDEAIFQNKFWLWAIMLLIIVILGWFSLKMISGSSAS